MKLLMNTAQFEFQLKSMFQRLLQTKVVTWDLCKKEASDRMKGAAVRRNPCVGSPIADLVSLSLLLQSCPSTSLARRS
jgi:hypothetical protein